MTEGKRQLFWVDGQKAQFVGVELVGGNVKLENGILSGFSSSSFAKLPFTVGVMDQPWMVVLSFKYKTSTSPMGMLGAIGSRDGFSPFFIKANDAQTNMNKQNTYLNGVGWPVTWDSGTINARQFEDGVDYSVQVSFDGQHTYSTGNAFSNALQIKTSYSVVDGQNLGLCIGVNRGNSLPFAGTVDLARSFMIYGEKLLWEGEAGAYGKVKRRG